MTPNPFKPEEIRKTLVLEALRANGGMTRKGILEYLHWEPETLRGNGGSILLLLELEGKIFHKGSKHGPYAMYYADPDIVPMITKPEES